jgi:hypothetical protein
LIKGTEVIWTCIDGDIDRPIITGAVPNPLNPSVTTHENNTSNVIKTSSGITMGFHDGAGSGVGQNATGGGAGDGLAAQQQNQRVNNSSEPSNEVQTTKPLLSNDFNSINQSAYRVSTSAQANPLGTDVKNHELQLQQQKANDGEFETSTNTQATAATADNIKFVLDVPYDTGKKSFLRLGDKGSDTESDGWQDYTDGHHISNTKGDRMSITDGKQTDIITSGKYSKKIAGQDSVGWVEEYIPNGSFGGKKVARKITIGASCETAITVGEKESVFGGFSFLGTAGLGTSLAIGGTLGFTIGSKIAFSEAISTSYTRGYEISHSSVGKISDAPTQTSTAHASNKLNVCLPIPAYPSTALALKVGGVALGAIVTGAVVAGVAHLAGVDLEAECKKAVGSGDKIVNDNDLDSTGAITTGTVVGVSTALASAITANSYANVAAHKLAPAITELSLTPATVRLGFGDEKESLKPARLPGIDITPGAITIGFGFASQIVITLAGIKIQTPNLTLDGTKVQVGSAMTTMLDVKGGKVGIAGTASIKLDSASISQTAATTVIS